MSIRHLDCLLAPRSVAVIGASERSGSVGATVWRNLREGGFSGPRWPVNPRHARLGDDECFTAVGALPQAPELAVICTPAATVPQLIQELGARGTRAAVVLSAGLDATTKAQMLQAARPHLLRILGPNGLGLLAPHIGLNASFAHIGAKPGSLAFVSQSGALVTAMLDWAAARGIGFSHCVSLGEHADVDFGDMLDWLAGCPLTRAVLLYAESIESARKFMSAARAAARNKPVLIVKAGRSAQGQAAAASHTGALAASDLVLEAAIRRAGMLRVDTLQDLFDAAETLSHFRGSIAAEVAQAGVAQAKAQRDRLTLVTNGGGAGVMAADAASAAGVALAALDPATAAALDRGLPGNWSHANPVDIIGDAPVERYVHTLRTLLGDPACGTLLFMHAPTAIVPSAQIAQALVPELRAAPGRVMACWLGGAAVAQARATFEAADIACFDTPESAVRAFGHWVEYRRNQMQLMQTPPRRALSSGVDTCAVAAIVEAALAQGRSLLSEPEAKALLSACGVPVVPTRVCEPDPAAAVRAAQEIGFPVALKLLSPQVTHKSDVGGVVLDLQSALEVDQAARSVAQRLTRARPDATLQGFTVQPMVRRPRAIELIVGSSVDPQFGPVLLFGQGGTAVEVLADRAVALPPLNEPLARALVQQTRVARLLAGWRDVAPADESALLGVLVAVSDLLAAEPRIAELDINPLLADAQGVIALDARVRVSAKPVGGAERFAIQPYPDHLIQTLQWQGRALTLRPIRPEDEPQHARFMERVDAADLRLRFFSSRRRLERSELARLTQIDYAREMAFIATAATESPEGEETLGVARAVTDPDNEEAEFAVVVRSDLKGGGLGETLMRKLITHQRDRGTRRMVGWVLHQNSRMLRLASRLGFVPDTLQPDSDCRRLVLALQPEADSTAAATLQTGTESRL